MDVCNKSTIGRDLDMKAELSGLRQSISGFLSEFFGREGRFVLQKNRGRI